MAESHEGVEYVGFWARTLAALVDMALSAIILEPIGAALYRHQDSLPRGALSGDPAAAAQWLLQSMRPAGLLDVLANWVLPAAAVIAFWVARQATPGKMLIRARIVDAGTLAKPTAARLVLRYLGYYLSLFPLGLGFLWVAWDPRKQGWHDKLANTLVVRSGRRDAPSANDRASPGG